MAKLPKLEHHDLTIEAALAGLERHEAQTRKPRTYLGMSSIGHTCDRRHWLTFRWSATVPMDWSGLLKINDGFRSENAVAEYLRHAPGLTLLTADPSTGKQFAFSDLGGHFRGHADGLAWGLLQAPMQVHVWECKVVGDDKFRAAQLAVEKVGEKYALAQWDQVYHVQAQLYMHYADAERHWTTIGSPGARRLMGIRTDRDRAVAKRTIARAASIIASDRPPLGISTDPAHYECRMCPASAVCHGREMAPVSCRTCLHSTPVMEGEDGAWTCAWHNARIPESVQRIGCPEHRYIPELLAMHCGAELVDASDQDNWVEYRTRDGRTFRNGSSAHDGQLSHELHAGKLSLRQAAEVLTNTQVPFPFARPGLWA